MNAVKIRDMIGFGGCRIEDDIIITETGMELMTNVPRTVKVRLAYAPGTP